MDLRNHRLKEKQEREDRQNRRQKEQEQRRQDRKNIRKIPFSEIKSSVVRQPEDTRDFVYALDKTDKTDKTNKAETDQPESYINPNIREIENQLNTGSCVANAACSSLEMTAQVNLSRMFVYYNARAPYYNLKDQDKGAYIRDGFKAIHDLGVCTESYWEFVVKNVNIKPNILAYEKAKLNTLVKYERISGSKTNIINSVKQAVLNNQPIIFGMELKESFYNISEPLQEQNYTGIGDSIGGHAMSVVGYDNSLGFIIENSWGTHWGDNGLGVLGYEFFADNVFDIWTSGKLVQTDLTKDLDQEQEKKLATCEKVLAFFKDLFNAKG